MEIYSSQYGVLMEVLAQSGIDVKEIAGIGITNQRETAILWDKETGRPVYNAIVWQCRRTAEYCEELMRDARLYPLREGAHRPADRRLFFRHQDSAGCWTTSPEPGNWPGRGKLLFGTVDTWLIWKLTGGKVHVTDYTNASRTMLYDIRNLCWDKTICDRLGIPMDILPRVCTSSEVYGTREHPGGGGAHRGHRRGPAGGALRSDLL